MLTFFIQHVTSQVTAVKYQSGLQIISSTLFKLTTSNYTIISVNIMTYCSPLLTSCTPYQSTVFHSVTEIK